MAETKYKLRYLPMFYEDFEQKIVYIAEKLQNEKADKDFTKRETLSVLSNLC